MFKYLFAGITAFSLLSSSAVFAQSETIRGTYKAVLQYNQNEAKPDEATFFQYATITVRTVNPGEGILKISANVRMIFGDWGSNEFLSYEFADVPFNLLTRQISLKHENNDVSFIGILGNGEIKGEWFSSSLGRVGKFTASKLKIPDVPQQSSLVKTATGHYKGALKNENSNSNLPERLTLSLVTTQKEGETGGGLSISGNMRFYLGELESNEYIETKLKEVKFNFYNRYLTLRTEDYGITIKGTLEQDGTLEGELFADGYGKIGPVKFEVH